MKLLVVDDDGLIRDSLKVMLSLEAGWTVETARDGNEALEVAARDRPELVLMDVRMPGCDGVEATRRLKAEFPDMKIVMLTTFLDTGYIATAMEAGAEGYLLKSAPLEVLLEGLRAVAKGTAVFDPAVIGRLTTKPAHKPIAGITERENEVLELVAQGMSNREIAEKLFLSQGTVRNVISSVLGKLELRDRTQLAVYYWKNRG